MAQELVVFPIQRSPYVFNIGTTKRQRVANTAGTAAYCFCREGKCQAANVAVVGQVLDQATAVRFVGDVGRASCWERVSQYREISVVAVPLKKKQNNI